MIPSFSTIFSVARVVEKSTVLGIQSVDSMNPWRVWAHHSFNKDCSQSFSGPSGRPKEPTTGPTFSPFFCRLGVRKVDPLGDSIRRLPDPLGGSGQIFVQQRLPPELPRATGPPQGAHKRTNIFAKIFEKNCRLEKSTLSGARSVGSLLLWGVQAEALLNKDCLQSFLGPLGPQGGSFNRDLRVTGSGLR